MKITTFTTGMVTDSILSQYGITLTRRKIGNGYRITIIPNRFCINVGNNKDAQFDFNSNEDIQNIINNVDVVNIGKNLYNCISLETNSILMLKQMEEMSYKISGLIYDLIKEEVELDELVKLYSN